ncbi:hypothetical protein [Sphaerisporangium sp. TRM90804]|uniref:hypothetical protein n=1 Tax=Sphaerisporangium sp. TRM90804 TaxID=3031113 RepID=UPI00244D6D09|nr:hypothetical protein [Sphaerisporangium sp. TRM90804]MDH2425739.1 hypothetical protein [Sphaerisporangium sp. TRM90804]
MLAAEARDHTGSPISPYARVIGQRQRLATVTDVGTLAGRPVVYLMWDPRHHLAARRDTVVASAVRVVGRR